VASCAAENVGGVHVDADVDAGVDADDADVPVDEDPADEPAAPEADELADSDSFVIVIVY
jgi:hypothetical protein